MPARRFTISLLVAVFTLGPSQAGEPKKIDFVHDVAPLIKARCAECHTNGKYKAGVSFDTREELLKSKAITPGKSGASELIKRITSNDPDVRMPPKGSCSTRRRSPSSHGSISAAWEPGFTFKVNTYVAPPACRVTLSRGRPSDRIVAAYSTQHRTAHTIDDAAFLPHLPRFDWILASAERDRRLQITPLQTSGNV